VDQQGDGRRLRSPHEAGRQSLEDYRYSANHAFANPTGQNYDKKTRRPWKRTLAFLHKNLA